MTKAEAKKLDILLALKSKGYNLIDGDEPELMTMSLGGGYTLECNVKKQPKDWKIIFDGEWITNDSWNEDGMFVYMDHMWITGQDENKTPFLAIKTWDGKLYPWVASQADVFSTKWRTLPKGDED